MAWSMYLCLFVLSCLCENHSHSPALMPSVLNSEPLFLLCLLCTLGFSQGSYWGERVLPNLFSGHGKKSFCGQDKGSMCASSHRMGMGGVSPKGEWCPAARRKNACLLCAKCCRQYPDVWVCTVLARLLDYCIFRFMSFTHDISRECTIA